MVGQVTTEVVRGATFAMWQGVLEFMPRLIAAVAVMFVGWLVAMVFGRAVYYIVRALHLDEALTRVGFKQAWEKTGIKLNSPAFFQSLVKWFFVIVFLMAVSSILGLDEVAMFLSAVVMYIPNVIVAAIVMLVGIVVSRFLEQAVRASVRASGLASANFLSALTKWSVFIFSLLIALTQLEVADEVIRILVIGMVSALSLALGLAFGLGGQRHADELIDRLRSKIED